MAACAACHCFSATTPTKLFRTTTLISPGTCCTDFSSTLETVAPISGGRTTRAMNHSRHVHIVNEFERAGHKRNSVHRRNWLSEHLPFARGYAFRRRAHGDLEMPAPNQLAIADMASALRADDSILDRKLIHRHL